MRPGLEWGCTLQRLPVNPFSQGGWFSRRAGLGTCTILLLSLILYLSLSVESAFSQQQLIGTYTVSSPANLAGGCIPDFHNPYQVCPNPGFPVRMGSPLLIPATPGSYSIIITGGSVFIGGIPCYQLPVTEFPCPTDATINLSVWSGDAATGYFVEVIPGRIGCCVNTGFQHKGGKIALYNSDQFAAALLAPITGSAVVQLYGSVGTPLSITTSSLPGGKVDTTYAQTLTATGGTPPYTWSVPSSTLPVGLSLTGNTISGTPTSGGTFNFAVQVTDSAGNTAPSPQPLKIRVGCAVSVTSWKQYTPWGFNDYDNSYITTTRYTSQTLTPVSSTGHMELLNGTSTFGITLTPSMNNLNALATLISATPGTNAIVGGSPGSFYLSVYNTRCQTQSCFPRPTNALHLCDGTCASAPDILITKLMKADGYAVTALTMALSYGGVPMARGVGRIQESGGPATFNALELNQFMANTLSLPSLGGAFSNTGDVDFANTPHYVARNTSKISLHLDNYSSLGGSVNSDFNLSGAEATLDQAVCTDHVPALRATRQPRP